MSSTAEFIFQFAEAVSAIALPVGGGLAAYAKWRRGAERDKRAREEAARIASERAAKDARAEEQATRKILIDEYQDRIEKLNIKYEDLRRENDKLHAYIIELLSAGRSKADDRHDTTPE
jgi:transposase-like protein